jgi:hypothetical protein
MKRYLNSGVSVKWIGWKFGQECQANDLSMNGNTDSNIRVLSIQSSFIRLLSAYKVLGNFLEGLLTLNPQNV